MVVSPDLGAQTGRLQGRGDVVLDQVSLLVREHVHGGIASLAVQGLVLEGNGIDGGAVRLECLDVLDKVLGKSSRVLSTVVGEVTIVQVVVVGVAVNGVVQLHPSRSTPGRSKDLEVGVEALHLSQHGGHGSTTVSEVEASHARVSVAAVVVISVGWVARQVRGTDGVAHEREAGTSTSHELVEQLAEGAGRQLVEGSDGGISHGSTETDDLLLVATAGVVDGQVPSRWARASIALNGSSNGGELVVTSLVGCVGLGTGSTRAVSGLRRHSNADGCLAKHGGDESVTHFGGLGT